jgi:hypothetical protein
MTTEQAEENAQLRRENAELVRANEILKAASALMWTQLDYIKDSVVYVGGRRKQWLQWSPIGLYQRRYYLRLGQLAPSSYAPALLERPEAGR